MPAVQCALAGSVPNDAGGSTEAHQPGPFTEVLMAMPAMWTLCSALCHRFQQAGKLESHSNFDGLL